MTPRKLLLLGVAAVLGLLLALWLAGDRRPTQDAGLMQPLAPELVEHLNEIERVRISIAGDQAVATLEAGEHGWVLLERDGYPADTGKLRELLLRLAEARRIEAKTANPELHDRLGVESIRDPEASGVQVAIEGGPAPMQLVVGYNRTQGTGSYLREADSDQSWLVDRNIAVERKTENWLQRELLDIEAARIARVEIRPAQGAPILIERSAEAAGDFRLLDLPSGRVPASEFVADASAGLLSSLRIDDVRRADALEPDPDSLREASYLTREGVRIDIVSWQADGKTWARFEAAFDAEQAAAFIDAEQASERQAWDNGQAALDAEATEDRVDDGDEIAPLAPLAVSDAEADRQQRIELAQDEVEALATKFDGWVFVLPNFKAANFNRDLEAYLRSQEG
jgi:hypothetical protein